jgi:hypothetical protein
VDVLSLSGGSRQGQSRASSTSTETSGQFEGPEHDGTVAEEEASTLMEENKAFVKQVYEYMIANSQKRFESQEERDKVFSLKPRNSSLAMLKPFLRTTLQEKRFLVEPRNVLIAA